MTKNEIKAKLDEAGVKYRAKATLEELQTMLEGLTPWKQDDFTMSESELAAQTLRPKPEDEQPSEEQVEAAIVDQGDAVVATASTGLKIEKDRPEQNGIKRPSAGGKCRAIWDALDAYRAETGEEPTAKTVRELAADEGWNPNNASIEFYQWKKYHGLGKKG